MKRTTLRHGLPLLLALGMAACKPTAAPAPAAAPAAPAATAAPAQAAHVPRTERLQAFLQTRYGKQARLSESWSGQADSQAVQSEVCAEQPVVVGSQVQQLLAVCHRLDDGGHANPGLIDFLILRDDGQGLAVVAEKLADGFGSDGDPGAVDILRLGSDFYGFVVYSSWIGQGLVLESQDLVLPGPKGLVNAGSVRQHIDNQGALDCSDEGRDPQQTAAQCQAELFDVDFKLAVDDSDPAARVWPVTIEETGMSCGKKLGTTQVFAFDATRWAYPFPDSMQREACE
ncbi:hypothetical protein QSH18_18365 [Xanthomonas sp. NCPPB 2654]|uniref:hypothetical protein n=1 Tax=unclassified Xanthomonas TaxID=2643310 RepID=UPI0021DF4C88|nr:MULTISPECIES: hypothetical protein [unclassified Xanthomonas]MDL5367579.1 hypothetical protein [Xanthomonas sp. NCPPB 2654]UYC21237.1 hypothetical protein NUG20_02720 [Xanthomonas sp. CFBP 8443]